MRELANDLICEFVEKYEFLRKPPRCETDVYVYFALEHEKNLLKFTTIMNNPDKPRMVCRLTKSDIKDGLKSKKWDAIMQKFRSKKDD